MVPPDRLTSEGAALLVVDVQEKLVHRLRFGPLVIANSHRLVVAARVLQIPVFATEQYPKGLGPTIDSLAELIPERPAKTTFHCAGAPGLLASLADANVRHVTLVGIEAHVCVLQTALELLKLGFRVQIPADAVASRARMDWEFALRRLEHSGVTVTTSEAVLFEWTERSDHPEFKAISALVKDFVPPSPA
ncbi:MAG: nicotinamidase-like amidase [Planctomycetota bacterium]|nr:nicotinamidase-like amidase [Planctomycetota bacterium]